MLADSLAQLAHRTVGDIMQHRVTTVRPDTLLSEAARLLWDERIAGVPVVDAQRRPVGFLSASDLVRFEGFGPDYRPPAGASADVHPAARRATGHAIVADIMTPVTISVRSTTRLPALAKFLVRAGIHHAPVVDRGELTGIVSMVDIVEEVANLAQEDEEPELELPVAADDVEC